MQRRLGDGGAKAEAGGGERGGRDRGNRKTGRKGDRRIDYMRRGACGIVAVSFAVSKSLPTSVRVSVLLPLPPDLYNSLLSFSTPYFPPHLRSMEGPPMSMFSMHVSNPLPFATVASKGYRLSTTRSIA